MLAILADTCTKDLKNLSSCLNEYIMYCRGQKTSTEFQSQHRGGSPAILAESSAALKDAKSPLYRKKAELVEF